MRAKAERAAARATALFTLEATLTWSGCAEAITVAVSGATKVTRPSPKTVAPGTTCRAHDAWGPILARRSKPIPASAGPTVSCRRGPMRWASDPDAGDSRNISAVAGKRATPAFTADQPVATWSS